MVLPWLEISGERATDPREVFRGLQILSSVRDQVETTYLSASAQSLVLGYLVFAFACLLSPVSLTGVISSIAGTATTAALLMAIDPLHEASWRFGPLVAVVLWITTVVVAVIGWSSEPREVVRSARKRRFALVTAAAVTLAAASFGGVSGWDAWKHRCSAQVAQTPDASLQTIHTEPVDRADLRPIEASNDLFSNPQGARAVLASAREPGGGFRPASQVFVANRSDQSAVPTGYLNDDPVVSVWRRGGPSRSVAVLDRTTGRARWGRANVEGAVPGRKVPGQLTTSQLGSRPLAASFAAADGELEWCTWIGKGTLTEDRSMFYSSLSADKELYVVRGPVEDPDNPYKRPSDPSVLLARIDARSGEVAWEESVSGVNAVGALEIFGEQILLSRVNPGPGWPRTLQVGSDSSAGSLVARSTSTGDAAWTYAGPDRSRWVVNAVGVHDDTALVVARGLTTDLKGASDDGRFRSWLIGLDGNGKERWRHDLRGTATDKLADATRLAGDAVLTVESTWKEPAQRLVAREIATGKARWTRSTGSSLSDIDLERSAVIGNQLVVAVQGNEGGLLAIDLATGREQTIIATGGVQSVVASDKSITFAAEGLVITLDRA
ncbi:hypothetical protein GCM10029976_077410 [Kribbella albertanoniae]|uniref:Uncharacterized protein n=2 Tax=Kribbella albertanoniae TaxID=1266829 RepID=A0A4R4Q5S9_9ACTN|nr:hypothetical protein E1261_13040 [Kribbella albertanoniae]